MKWFKFYGQDFQTDPKIGFLNPLQKLMWVNLLCIASQDEEHSGVLKFISENHLKAISGITDNQFNDDWDRTTGTLALFEEMGLIENIDKNTIKIKNFKSRQDTNLTDAERAKRYREKKNVTNVTQTSQNSHTRLDKIRIDKNKIENTLSNESVPSKTLKNFRDTRRIESGRQPMTPRKSSEKQKAFMAAAKSGIEYFKEQGQQQHGMDFLTYTNDKRNAIVLKLVTTAYEKIGDLKELIDWWFEGEGAWAKYEPEQCFAVKTIERFKNKGKIKTKATEWWQKGTGI